MILKRKHKFDKRKRVVLPIADLKNPTLTTCMVFDHTRKKVWVRFDVIRIMLRVDHLFLALFLWLTVTQGIHVTVVFKTVCNPQCNRQTVYR